MSKVYIIAEVGVNHNGDIELAKKLIDVAVEARANAVKFQTFVAEKLATKKAILASYQKLSMGEVSQLEMLKKLELSKESHKTLIKYCKEKQIDFLSTPFDIDSLLFLLELGLDTIKIPSGEITNFPLLKEIGKKNKKVILSTGMSSLEEIKNALKVLENYGTEKKKITVLQANTSYPTPLSDVNLLSMKTIQDTFQVKVGYSDHTLGINASLAAVALGACIIEKHFTLDRKALGPDHVASLEPIELINLVKGIREIELCMGSSIKLMTESEKKNIDVVRKSIVANEDIKLGDLLTENNLTTKRPGLGLSPMKWEEVIGTLAIKKFQRDELIKLK
ncbi:MAG: N-acetylneuraminate synthase [Candidatus Cloacimonadota bacterium]|nr:MAG: N-acetylneuraminate synthase [Candidatus Cloacimonadota bacterium]